MKQEQVTKRQWIGLCGISLLAFTIFLDITIVANALPAIQKSFDASTMQLQWLTNAIYIALCALMATTGRLGDIYGLRKVFYICMIIMAAASLGCGLSNSMNQLIFFRVIQGISLSSLSISAALISHNFPLSKQAKAMSIFSVVTGAGLVFGPIIGGFIVDYLNWRWIFYINVPIVAIGISICVCTLTEKREHHHNEKIDWSGVLFFVVVVTSLVTTMVQGQTWGWNSFLTIGGFIVAAVASIAFMINEKYVSQPFMQFSLLANRVFIPAAFVSLTCGAFISTLLFFNPLYLQNILGYSATDSGWILLSISIAYIIFSPIAGFITNEYSPKTGTWLIAVALIVSAIFHAFFNVQGNLIIIFAGFICFGIAWGMVNVSPVVAVMQTVSPNNVGVIMGSLWTVFNVGCSLGIALANLVFQHVEKTSLINSLTQFITEPGQKQLLDQLIAEPEHHQQIMQQFPPSLAEHVIPAYQQSFVHSFNVVAWIFLILAIVCFIVTFFIMKQGEGEKVPSSSLPKI